LPGLQQRWLHFGGVSRPDILLQYACRLRRGRAGMSSAMPCHMWADGFHQEKNQQALN